MRFASASGVGAVNSGKLGEVGKDAGKNGLT